MLAKLRTYQAKADIEIDDAWSAGHRNVLFVMACGGGKSPLVAHKIEQHNGACVALAHRQELVGQMSRTLAKWGVRHRIIGPPNVIKAVIQSHIQLFGKDFYDPNSRVAVAGVDTLVRRAESLAAWCNQVTLWVVDECFPAGTLVDGRPIESIQVGDTVTAFDEKTGLFENKIVLRTYKNPSPEHMVHIDTKSHHVLDCTAGHPFWTKRGWVQAINLTTEDEVLIHELLMVRERNNGNNGVTKIPFSQNGQDLLSQDLRIPSARLATSAKKESRATKRLLYNLRETSRLVRFPKTSIRDNRQSILQQQYRMCKSVSVPAILRNNVTDEPKIRIGSNDKKQPNVVREIAKQNEKYVTRNRTQTLHSGRKRQTPNSSRSNTSFAILRHGICSSINCHYKNASRLRIPNSLQNRLRTSEFENCLGSRREQSFNDSAPRTGSEERAISYWTRLDSVTFQKCDNNGATGSSDRDGYVYNIEVEDFHTYIANGVVVHNCHHLIRENKWGKAVAMFPNAKGLGVTATPERTDGKGLGIDADGVFDVMIEGPGMRELINGLPDWNGVTTPYLTDYRIFCPPSNLDLTTVATGQDGDYIRGQLALKTRESNITGHVIEHYLRIAPGKLGITFAPDVETASIWSQLFNEAGVPSEVISAKTPDRSRIEIMKRFERRQILMLCNCDILGEGVDVPAVEVVIMGRATQSYNLYVQQFGRMDRLMEGKLVGILIDHVNNVMLHGLPDRPREWSLERKERKSSAKDPDVIPMRTCANPDCLWPYERFLSQCPYCGTVPVPAERTAPEMVDGVLGELLPEVLTIMRGEVRKVDQDPIAVLHMMQRMGHPEAVAYAARNRHIERQVSQGYMREAAQLWMGYNSAMGRDIAESQRRFFHRFKTDILTAQALGRSEADEMCQLICNDLLRLDKELRTGVF